MQNGVAGPFRLTLYTLLAFAAAQQQQQPRRVREPSEGGSINGSPPENAALRQLTQTAKQHALSVDSTHQEHRRRKDTHLISNARDERAVATLAPADGVKISHQAVRALSARSAAGTGSPAGSGLQPLQQARRLLADWEVEDFVLLATVDGSIYARDRNTGRELWKFYSERPMVDISYAKDYDTENGYQWIVEPTEGGNIYMFLPDSPTLPPGVKPGMHRYGFSVKELVDISPYEHEEEQWVFTADKKNTMYTLNATNGAPLKYYSTSGMGITGQRVCSKIARFGGLEDDEDECEPTPTLMLGRSEYTVSIQDKFTQEVVCTIKFFEWIPNKRDDDLTRQYQATLDNMYIYSRFDGEIMGMQHNIHKESDKKKIYSKKQTSPVVRVFDILRPQGTDARETLTVIPQPVPKAEKEGTLDNLFINCTEDGSFYAMSEKSYPSVTDGAKKAQCYDKAALLDESPFYDDEPRPKKSVTPASLVGVHVLNQYVQEQAPAFPLLAAPETSVYQPVELADNASKDPVQIGPISGSIQIPSVVSLFALFVGCVILGYTPFRKRTLAYMSKQTDLAQVIAPQMKQVSMRPPEGLVDDDEPPVLASGRRVRFSPDVADDGAETGNETAVEVPQELLVYGPWTEDGTPPANPSIKKKKRARGSRGGQKNRPANLKRKQKNGGDENAAESDVDKIVEGVVVPEQSMQPSAGPTMEGKVSDVNDSMKVQSIKVDIDKVLGFGSGGTVVYEGTFEGREVAVKRMLLQYYDLASQEVSLLSQSDDHENVVRYFRHEKDQNFLYIAVERCQTSLWDLYKDGNMLEGLKQSQASLLHEINSNISVSLYQIAKGLQHLHSLRIIHRDIKPQNILVAYPKKNQPKGRPRLVISDFGLCRMLPDSASTLVGTVGNAGTIGWKAPEVIGQPRNGAGNQSSTQQDSNSNSSNSEQGNSTPGVKRAVDIFSLGCVFYYVLTSGAHPFDADDESASIGHVEREINIKKWDRPRLHKLSQWGEHTEEPRQLIEWMLAKQPEHRPTAQQVLAHPFFWSDRKRLDFLCDVSDHWERECRDPPSPHLLTLEDIGRERAIHHGDFLAALDKCLVDSLGKQRKYTGDRMLDLLRALRNKKNHYADLDEFTRRKVGDLPSGYLKYWMRKFPGLLMACWSAVRECGLADEPRFRAYMSGEEGV